MATSIKVGIQAIVECAICMESFKNPKCLPCIHTFCLQCLEDYGKSSKPGDEMACPMCRQKFKVPSGGFAKLPNNFFVEQVLDNHKLTQSDACDGLAKCDFGLCNGNEATKRCVECAQIMCESCAAQHGKLKVTQTHQVVPFEKNPAAGIVPVQDRTAYCEIHKAQEYKQYCYDCKQTICAACAAAEHKTHHCDDLLASRERLCKQLKEGYLKLNSCIEVNEDELKLLTKNRKSMLEQSSENSRSLAERSAEIKSRFDAECDQLFDKLESLKNKSLKEMLTREDEVERQLMIMRSFQTYVEELTEKGSALAVAQSASDLMTRTAALEAAQAEFSVNSIDQEHITRHISNIQNVFSARSQLLGRTTFTDVGSRDEALITAELRLMSDEQKVSSLSDELLNYQTIVKCLNLEMSELDKTQQQLKTDKTSLEQKLAMLLKAKEDMQAELSKRDMELSSLRTEQLVTREREKLKQSEMLAEAGHTQRILHQRLMGAEQEIYRLNLLIKECGFVPPAQLYGPRSLPTTPVVNLSHSTNSANNEGLCNPNVRYGFEAKSGSVIPGEGAMAAHHYGACAATHSPAHPGQSHQGEECRNESVLVCLGWSYGKKMIPRTCHINLQHQDQVKLINDKMPTWINIEAAACVVGDALYAVGIGRDSNELWKWNAASGWTRCQDLRFIRTRHCVAVADLTIYVLGGYDDRTTLKNVASYDTRTNEWASAGKLSTSVQYAACVFYKNAIYVFGGEDQYERATEHVQMYTIAQQKSRLLDNEMPEAHSHMRAVLWETSAIVVGKDMCYIYNIETQSWHERKRLKTEWDNFALVIDNGTLYIAGGGVKSDDWYVDESWDCEDQIKSVLARDVIEGRRKMHWRHHAKLTQPGMIHMYGCMQLALRP